MLSTLGETKNFLKSQQRDKYTNMAGKRKSFKNYSEALAFVVTLGLTSMQDWIAYAKSGKRPADIPSNPWTAYKSELAAMTPPQKFNINTFIGCKLARKSKKTDGTVTKAVKPAKVAKAVKPEAKPKTVAKTAKADKKTDAVTAPVGTPFEIAKAAIQELKLPNREAFYELKRKNLLPAGVPRKPEETFKTDWKGWGDFLGNGNKAVASKPAEASATF